MSLFGKQRDGREGTPEAAPSPPTRAADAGSPASTSRLDLEGKGGDPMANIGKSIAIKGDLTGNEDLVIEGRVEGRVELPDNQLTVGANGTVQAEVHAKSVVVVGKVTGNVKGTDRVEIQATGTVQGDVSAPRLVVAEGAVINGAVEMSGKEAAAARPAPVKPPSSAGGANEARKAVS